MKDTYYTRQRIKDRNDVDSITKELAQRNKDYDDLQHSYNALKTMNDEQDKIIKDYIERANKEGMYYTINNGYVTSINIVPAYREYTYIQSVDGIDLDDLIDLMHTPLYAQFPFVQINDRQLEISEIEYTKFIGGLI